MDEIVESFNDVGLKDRSMVWNTDLVEVRAAANGNRVWCRDYFWCHIRRLLWLRIQQSMLIYYLHARLPECHVFG